MNVQNLFWYLYFDLFYPGKTGKPPLLRGHPDPYFSSVFQKGLLHQHLPKAWFFLQIQIQAFQAT